MTEPNRTSTTRSEPGASERTPRSRTRNLGASALGLALIYGAVACTAEMPGMDDGQGPDGGPGAGGSGLPGSGGNGPGPGPGTGGAGPGAGGTGPIESPELPAGFKYSGAPEYYRVVRLTHSQWDNAVQQVLKLSEPTGLTSGLASDPPNGKFTNNERALYITGTLRGDYQRVAETLAESVATNSAALAALGPAEPAGLINAVGERAYRRQLTAEEVSAYQTLWEKGASFYSSGNAFADGARIFIEALLQSPDFLYRVELTDDGQRLSGPELATKLSLLLRNAPPNEELMNAARSGALDTNDGLVSTVNSLLDENSARFAVDRYHTELFSLSRYQSISKSPARFPNYNEGLNSVLLAADLRFFGYIYEGGLGVREILKSDVAFVNEATAGFYGISASGPDLQQVELDGSRPGFLTRLGFLAVNGTLVDPDPIHRGVDINRKLICAHLDPPPGEIPPLPDPVPGQTNRERVVAHTEVPQSICEGCHGAIINPPGFALESFDAVGQFRTTDNDKPVNTAGSFYVDGGLQPFADIRELTDILADSPTVHACYAAQFTEFAFGRDIGSLETELLVNLYRGSLDSDSALKAMLLAAITSPQFTTAKTGAQ